MSLSKSQSYAVGQHLLCCEELNVKPGPDDPGETLIESVCRMRQNGYVLAARLLQSDIPLDNAERAAIAAFLPQNNQGGSSTQGG